MNRLVGLRRDASARSAWARDGMLSARRMTMGLYRIRWAPTSRSPRWTRLRSGDGAVSSDGAAAAIGDRREYLSIQFTAHHEVHRGRGGQLVIAGDAHDQHDGTARQSASLDRRSWQVIGGTESRHTIDGVQGHRRRRRVKRVWNHHVTCCRRHAVSTWPRKVVRARTLSSVTFGRPPPSLSTSETSAAAPRDDEGCASRRHSARVTRHGAPAHPPGCRAACHPRSRAPASKGVARRVPCCTWIRFLPSHPASTGR